MKPLYESILNVDLKTPTKNMGILVKIRKLLAEFCRPYYRTAPSAESKSIGWNDEPICYIELKYPTDYDIKKLFEVFVGKLKKVTTVETDITLGSAYSPAYYTAIFPKMIDSKNEPLKIWITDSREADEEYFTVEAPKNLFDK